ncbi:hypothetical protein [Naumannella huperziae]
MKSIIDLFESSNLQVVPGHSIGIYQILNGPGRPVAVAKFRDHDLRDYLQQLAAAGSGSGLTPEQLLRIHVMEEVSTPGWTSKTFGLRRKPDGTVEWFSDAVHDESFPGISGSGVWLAHPPGQARPGSGEQRGDQQDDRH